MATGINFRATAGYVADGGAETYSLGEAYPVTRGGLTFGFSSSLAANARDRSTGVDRRLAGCVFQVNTAGTVSFRVDLPSPGTYEIRLALGDANNAQNHRCLIHDDSTLLATIEADTLTGQWLDAQGGVHFSSNGWVTGNAARTLTFATTSLILTIGGDSSGTFSTALSHLSVVNATPPSEIGGNVTQDGNSAAGALTSSASDLAGGPTLDALTPAGTLSNQPGRIVTGEFRSPLTGLLMPDQAIAWCSALRASDGQQVATLTGQQTSGGAVLTVDHGALLPGVGYLLVAYVGTTVYGAEYYVAGATP